MITVGMGGKKTKQYPLQQPVTEMSNIYMEGHPPMPATFISAYNRYTEDINRCTWHEQREFLLDQRHRFFVQTMFILKEEHDSKNK